MATAFTTEAFALLGVGLSVIIFRTAIRVRAVGVKGLQIDDYVMLLAAVIYSLETAAAYSVGFRFHGLANSGMTDAARASLDPSSEEWKLRVGGSKLQLIGWSLYTLLLWLLKLALIIFYSRLTEGVKGLNIRIKIGLAMLLITYLTTELSILFGCGLPFKKNWQINPNPGNYCQPAISKVDILVTVVLNVSTDMYLLSIPLPMLWTAHLPRRKKIALLVIFSGGIFVMMAGILRCVLILTNPITGAEQAGSWAVRETFVAVVTSNAPMIYPFVRNQVVWVLELPAVATVTSRIAGGPLSAATDRRQKATDGSGSGLHSAQERRKERRKFSKWGTGLSSIGSQIDITVRETGGDSGTDFDLEQYPRGTREKQGGKEVVGLDLGKGRDVGHLPREDGDNISGRHGSEDGMLPLQTHSQFGSVEKTPQSSMPQARQGNLRSNSTRRALENSAVPRQAIAVTTEMSVDIEDAPSRTGRGSDRPAGPGTGTKPTSAGGISKQSARNNDDRKRTRPGYSVMVSHT